MTPRYPLERDTSKAVKQLFEGCGCTVYETPQGFKPTGFAMRRTAGIPDLLVFCERRNEFWVWEVKRPSGKRTAAQVLFANRCAMCHVGYGWGGVEEARAFLRDRHLVAA